MWGDLHALIPLLLLAAFLLGWTIRDIARDLLHRERR